MNKPVLAIILVLVVAAAGAAYYFTQGDDVTLARNAAQGSGEATCSFTDPETGDTGTVYIKDGNMRSTATVDTPGAVDNGEGSTTTTNALFTDDTTYIWSEGETQGLKFPAEDTDEVDPNSEEAFSLRDADEEEFRREFEENNFSCSRGVDEELLELPEGVEFIDFETFQQNLFDVAPTQ